MKKIFPKLNLFKRLKSFLLQIVLIISSVIFVLIVLPFTLVAGSPFYIYRYCVILIAKIFKPNLSTILSTTSAIFASEDLFKDPQFIITTSIVLEGVPNIKSLRESFEAVNNSKDEETGKSVYPEMNQNISHFCGYPFWKTLKTPVNIEDLVHFYKNDENMKTDQDLLEKVIREEHWFEPYEKERPLWEAIIFPNFSSNQEQECFVVVFKVHHALMDGFALASYAQKFSTEKENIVKVVPRNYVDPTKKGGNNSVILSILKTVCKMPQEICEIFLTMVKYPWMPTAWQKVKKVQAPLLKNKYESCISSTTVSFPLQDLRDVKNKHPSISGITVVYTAVVEALRQTMFSNDKAIPKHVGAFVALPVPGHKGNLRNHLTVGKLSLPLSGIESLDRMYLIQDQIDKLRQSTVPISASITLVMAGALPRWLIRIVISYIKFQDLIITSNFAVPKNFNDMCGYKILDFVPGCGGVVGTNLFLIFMLSYNGMMKVVITADAKLLKSTENSKLFTQIVTQQIQNLKSLPPMPIMCQV